MHPALLLDEVLRSIISHLRIRKDKLNLALTCHHILEPALDSIWSVICLDNLKPLLPLFPREALNESFDGSELTLTRVLAPHEWTRFDYLARRIRTVTSCNLFRLPGSLCRLITCSLKLRGERYLLPSTIHTLYGLKLRPNTHRLLLPSFLNPSLNHMGLGALYVLGPGIDPANMKDAMEETLIMLCACDLVCLQSLTISTGEYSPPSLMDPTPLMNFLRRNVSLKRVILELPVPAGAVMEVLSHISQLQALGVRWWRDSSNTESEAATGTMIVPESLGSLRSLHRIACDKVSTLRHILAYASVCLLTSLQIEVHSSAVAQELFGVIQSCSSLKSLQITPPRGCGRFVWPRFAEMGSPLDAKLSFDSVLACTAMESFRIHAKGILPPNDIDLWSISTAWTNLSTFAWSSWSVYTPRATLTGLSALSTNCRKLQRVGVPIMVNPELPIHTPYQPFCDGIMVDTVEWKVDNAVNVEELIGVLATLAPRQWSRDGTQWLSTRKAKKGLWKVIEDKFGNYQLDGGLDVVVVRFDRDVGA